MDNNFKGENLKTARLFRGWTLTELGKKTGISKQSISLYENNINKPEFEKLMLLAKTLGFPRQFFFADDILKTKTDVTYFRSLASSTKMSRTSQSIKLEYVAKIYEILEEYIDFPKLNIPSIFFNGNDDIFNVDKEKEMENQIEKIANDIRESWEIGDEPINDLQYILEKNGIIVTGFDTEDLKIDAFSQRTIIDSNEVFFIALSQGHFPECRINFDMAHELGHIVLHPWSENLELISKEEFKLRERQANMFASSFLMPKKSFSKDVILYPTDLQYYQILKKKWNCSIQSMVYRSHSIGIISDNQYQYMMRQISKKGWRQKEPYDVPYSIKQTIFQEAIDLLIYDSKIINAKTLLSLFSKYGVVLNAKDIEKILHLREGTLNIEENEDKVISLKLK